MNGKDYLKDKAFSIVTFIAAGVLAAGFLWLINVSKSFIVFAELIFFIGFFIPMLLDFIKRKQYYNTLLEALEGLEEKTLLPEIVKQTPFIEAQILYEIIRKSDKHMNDKIAVYDKEAREYREYVEMWVHEIKTPVTSARLMIENDKNVTTLRIGEELRKIDGFVEQALYYARSTSLEKDFKVEQTSLQELVTSAVKIYAKPIIQADGQIEMDSLNIMVYADKKWLLFIIGQILNNAVKYQNGNLIISFKGCIYENGVYLEISDNGIGITEKDLSRVFHKGFTGENGRCYNKSTGIGLYLCKKLCLKMNMEISISSIVNQGTKVKIYFPKNSLLL